MYNDTGKSVSRPHPSTVSAAVVTTPRTAGIPYPLLHHHQDRHPIMTPFSSSPYLLPFSASASAYGGADDDDDFPRRDERFPQWSNQETRDLIEIRAQFELEFTTAKRDRYLWEMVADGMRKRGYRRTPDQCKCKWEDLISRFKTIQGQETTDVDNRQCPFSDELHSVFTARANRMQPPQPSITKTSKTLTNASEDRSHEDDMEVEQAAAITRTARRRKTSKEKRQKMAEDGNCPDKNNSVLLNSLDEMMRNFVEQQQRIDVQWRESMEKHAREREVLEEGWRRKMENLERERLMMENAWREREEQRKSREESRAEKRDALLKTLLNKLINEGNH
ncbi:hypothetical protein OROMI_008838 [Orobanche minor]